MSRPATLGAVVATSLLLQLAAGPAAASPPDGSGLYLGHTRVEGERKVPILGRLVTRTDTWVLATIEHRDGALVIDQRPCRLDIKPFLGVRVELANDAVPLLPGARFELLPDPALVGRLHGAPWKTGWDVEDVDQDGAPGATMRVRSALCGGTLAVASDTTSEAWAHWEGDALVGTLEVQVGQRILDASGACLRAAAKDSVEQVAGTFRYTPLPAGSTCDTVTRQP